MDLAFGSAETLAGRDAGWLERGEEDHAGPVAIPRKKSAAGH